MRHSSSMGLTFGTGEVEIANPIAACRNSVVGPFVKRTHYPQFAGLQQNPKG